MCKLCMIGHCPLVSFVHCSALLLMWLDYVDLLHCIPLVLFVLHYSVPFRPVSDVTLGYVCPI